MYDIYLNEIEWLIGGKHFEINGTYLEIEFSTNSEIFYHFDNELEVSIYKHFEEFELYFSSYLKNESYFKNETQTALNEIELKLFFSKKYKKNLN